MQMMSDESCSFVTCCGLVVHMWSTLSNFDFICQRTKNRNPFTQQLELEKKKWGNLDLNQGLAGYEGGRLSYYPLPSNRYEQDDKGFMPKMLLEFVGF